MARDNDTVVETVRMLGKEALHTIRDVEGAGHDADFAIIQIQIVLRHQDNTVHPVELLSDSEHEFYEAA